MAAPGSFCLNASSNLQISYSDFEDFAVAANVDYELVPGFKIQPEIDYQDNFGDDDDFSTTMTINGLDGSACSVTSNQLQG